MAPVSEYFIFNVTMNLIHIIIDALVSISLLRIAYARKNKVAYYLGMTGLTLCGTASLVLYFFIRGILLDQTLEVIGTSVVLNSIAILFLNRFINQLYTRPSEKTIRILTIFYLTFTIIIIIILTINMTMPNLDPEFENQIYPLFSLYAVFGLGGNLLTYLFMIRLTLQSNRKVEKGSIEHKGGVFIFWYGFFALFSFLMMLVAFALLDEGLMLGFTWFFSTLSSIFAYFSFIYPRKLREKSGELVLSPVPVHPFVKAHHQKIGFLYEIMALIVGFYLNLKFIQLGIPDLGGENNLNVGINTISTGMISLGISGFISCILIGFYLNRKRIPFHQKPPIVAGFSAATLFLVVISGYITPQLYVPWIFVLGFVFGASTCIMYSFIFDLIPQQYRGLNAGILTGIIYLIGASSMEEWTFWNFRRDIIIWLGLTLIIQIIYIIFNTFDEEQIAKIQDQPPKYTFDLKLVCVLLFLILFIDSFGFLRIVGNPEILAATWQGTQGFRFYIGMIHFTTAILIGVYYNKLKPLNVAMISVILFILADGMLALIEFNPTIKYILPILYASAVSIYTLVFLSLLADISTKENYYKVIGIGMAVFGWFSSYLATAISLSLIGADITNPVVSFRTHLGIASLIAIITLGFIIWMKKATQSK